MALRSSTAEYLSVPPSVGELLCRSYAEQTPDLKSPDNTSPLPALCKGVEVERDEELDFDTLYALTGPRLWRAILAYTGGRRELTDDVVAEAFTRTLEQSDNVREPAGYLYRVAFRLAAAELRRPAADSRIPEGTTWDDPGLTELFDVFGHLSPGQRAAVFLRFQADLPTKEVAQLMGTSPGVVRIHLFRARRTLKTLLGGGDDD